MQSNDLKPWQARALKNKIRPMLSYLNRLKRRMHRRGFQHGDPLLEAVTKAEIAVHELYVQTHYLSCPHTTGGNTPSPSGRGPG
jgi:hypothetical protein